MKTMNDSLAQAIRRSSAKTFAIRPQTFDKLLTPIVSLVAGVTAYWHIAVSGSPSRPAVAILAAASTNALLVILRALVPFTFRLSFADMMRLRMPFYFWMLALVFSVSSVQPFVRLYSSCSPASCQFTLMLLTVAFAVRFFQSGSFFRLALAYACAGAAFGVSAIGILAIFVLCVVKRCMADGLFLMGGYGWRDRPNAVVVDYFTNPLVGSRMKWIFLLCFAGGLGMAVTLLFLAGKLRFELECVQTFWLGGINLDGVIVFVGTAVLPAFLVLRRIDYASDTAERPEFAEMAVYFVIGVLSAVFLLKPETVKSAFGLSLKIDSRLLALSVVVAAYDVLVSVMVMLIDIRCRDFRGTTGVSTEELRPQMRFTFVVASAAPFVFAALVALIAFRHVRTVGVPEKSATEEVEMVLSPKEAFRIALERKSFGQAERYALKILAESPLDLEANLLLGQRRLDDGDVSAAEPFADAVFSVAPDDPKALSFAKRVYEACDSKIKAASVRERIIAVRKKGSSGVKRMVPCE